MDYDDFTITYQLDSFRMREILKLEFSNETSPGASARSGEHAYKKIELKSKF